MIQYGITTQTFMAFGQNAKVLHPVEKDRLVIIRGTKEKPHTIIFSLPELPNLKLRAMPQYIKMRE